MSDVDSRAWTICELSDLCRTITDGTHQPPPFSDAGIPFLFVRNIVRGEIDFNVEKYISPDTYKELTKKHKAQLGDVLFSAVGSFGVAVVVRTSAPFAFQRHIAHIKPDATRIDAEFLAYFLNSARGRSQSEAVAMGGAQRSVTLTDLRRFRIPVPPLEQQRQISAGLRASSAIVERARHAAEGRLTAAQAIPAAYLRSIFDGPTASKWTPRQLSSVLRETRNGLYKHEKFYGDGVSILKMFNIGRFDGRWHLDRLDRVRLSPAEHEQYRLEQGDILINRVNSRELVGKCAVIDSRLEGAVFESKNIRARVVEEADPNFVAYWFNSQYAREQIESRIKQIVGQATLNGDDIRGLEMPFPALSDQQQIVARISRVLGAAESLIARCRDELAELEALPTALLRTAFDGGS